MIDALKREPLFRALRCDKLILSALESTVDTYLRGDTRIPVVEMMQVGNDELRGRAERIVAALDGRPLEVRIGSGRAQIGGGTLPRSALPSVTIDVRHPTLAAQDTHRPSSRPAGAGDRLRRPRQRETRSADDLSAPGRRRDRRAPGRLGRLTSAMSDATHYIVATAGHVDHGKSALIKALTGTDPDRLPEEKARGITIDLGFAHLDLPSPTSSSSIHVGIVDVPGHEDFVKNMVAGVGSIDLALLVVAADDGWMPQTEEHLQILTYLGVRRAVVALTKSDLAGRRSRRGFGDPPAAAGHRACRCADRADVGRHRTRARRAEVHAGARALRRAAVARHRQTPAGRRSGVHVAGNGNDGHGTLAGGTLQRGQSVVIQPGGHPARIRRIQSHGRDVEASGPGTRTALNLADVNPGEGVHRGDVVTLPEMGGCE